MEIPKLKKGIDHIGVCVVYFCHDGKGNILLSKRSQNTRDEQGKWDIGGGGLDLGEMVEDCLKREIKEEYCTDVLSFEFLGFRDVHRVHGGNKTHWIGLDFKVLVDASKVRIGEPESMDDIGWFTLQNIPQPLHSQLHVFFEKYKEKLK